MIKVTYLLLILSAIFAVVIAAFSIQNSAIVNIHLFVWDVETSLVLVILGAVSLGFSIAISLGLVVQMKLRFQLYKTKQRIGVLEAKLETKEVANILESKGELKKS